MALMGIGAPHAAHLNISSMPTKSRGSIVRAPHHSPDRAGIGPLSLLENGARPKRGVW